MSKHGEMASAFTPASRTLYRNGGVRLANGNPTQSGAQVFPGFRPENEVDEHRTAVGAYIDLEANVTEEIAGVSGDAGRALFGLR